METGSSNKRFVHLNIHSEYSIHDGILKVDDISKFSYENNMPAAAITELGNLFSTIKFYQSCIKSGIKPIIGVDLRITDGQQSATPGRLVLLCQNMAGYHNLTYLITKSYREGQHQGLPYVYKEWFPGYTEGLIAISGGIHGDIGIALSNNNADLALNSLKFWKELFPQRFYIELHRTKRPGEEDYIQQVVHLASETDTPVVATNDARFLNRDDYEAHEAKVCIQQGYVLNDTRRPRINSSEQYLHTISEMEVLFSDIPEAIENTINIAMRCNLEFNLGQNYLPHFPVPDDYTQDSWLRHTAKEGLNQLIKNGDIPAQNSNEYKQRLDNELDVIIQMGFPGYFLIVADFISWAKSNDIPVGPGRGSGAGSLVAYALGITELDPLKYDLLFERFLNPERVSLPDFDVDFCMQRRDEVIEYVAERYGRDHVSQIITHGSMAAKAVIRDVGRVLGYPYGYVDQLAKLVPFELDMTLERALEQEQILRERYEQEENVNTLINLAMKLEGLTRNSGRHAGGIVIAPKPLTNYMPLYTEQGSTSTVSQFDMTDVEAVGLVKFDFLGLRTLTIIHDTVRIVRDSSGKTSKEFSISRIPLDDPDTYQLIRRTDTTAIFQLESDGMKKLIKRLQPDSFDDLIALVALFRPGPLQSGMVDDYIERKHGRMSLKYPHPKLENILKPTYGVILYQEQVMQIARELAGYTLGSADLLRRAMGKKKPEEMAKQREVFVNGAIENRISKDIAMFIFDLMEKFAGYGFNKSHSAAYALIAYQTAWLKCHYPAAFMASVLSSDIDNTDKVVMLLDELERMQIIIDPPDINHSNYNFTVSGEKSIRYGLGAIKGVGYSAIEHIIHERSQSGLFTDLFDFCRRLDLRRVNKRVLEALIKSGALDGLGPNRNSMISSLAQALQFAEQSHQNNLTGQDDLFGLDVSASDGDLDNSVKQFVQVNEWEDRERLSGEKETLGFYLNGHPIIRYEEELANIVTCRLKNMRQGTATVAGYIHRIRTRSGMKGRMAEIVLDDRTARAFITVYSDIYQKFRDKLTKDRLIIVKGDVTTDDFYDSGYALVAREIMDIDDVRNNLASVCITLPAQIISANILDKIKTVLTDHANGHSRVLINYMSGDALCNVNAGKNIHVKPSDSLMEELADLVGKENVTIVYNM